jgi:hypothetical protein
MRTVEFRGAPIAVRVAAGRMSQVEFWTDIGTVVSNFTKEQVSIETAGRRIYLMPRTHGLSGELFVVLTTAQSITLAVVDDPDRRDLTLRVLAPAGEVERSRPAARELTPLRLLRAMLLDRPLTEITVVAGGETVVYDDGAVQLRLARIWTTPTLQGLILTVENLRPAWIRLPVDSLALPGLLAVHIEAETLAPPPTTPEERVAAQHRTRLFLVRIPSRR